MDTRCNSNKYLFSEEKTAYLFPIKMTEETNPVDRTDFLPDPDYYTLYVVTFGEGVFVTPKKEYAVKEGDAFVTFPNVPYSYRKAKEDFRFVALSFTGNEVDSILSRVDVSAEHPYRGEQTAIKILMQQSLERAVDREHVVDFLARAALWEALVIFGENAEKRKTVIKHGEKKDRIAAIIHYIKENYNRTTLSLEGVASHFSINPNYLSRLFKEIKGVNFSVYLTSVRVERACFLMESGLSSVKNIAFLVGFGDPLYFSKVFKKETGFTPREYVDRVTARRARAEQRAEF